MSAIAGGSGTARSLGPSFGGVDLRVGDSTMELDVDGLSLLWLLLGSGSFVAVLCVVLMLLVELLGMLATSLVTRLALSPCVVVARGLVHRPVFLLLFTVLVTHVGFPFCLPSVV